MVRMWRARSPPAAQVAELPGLAIEERAAVQHGEQQPERDAAAGQARGVDRACGHIQAVDVAGAADVSNGWPPTATSKTCAPSSRSHRSITIEALRAGIARRMRIALKKRTCALQSTGVNAGARPHRTAGRCLRSQPCHRSGELRRTISHCLTAPEP